LFIFFTPGPLRDPLGLRGFDLMVFIFKL
jgi:hypothetical protein